MNSRNNSQPNGINYNSINNNEYEISKRFSHIYVEREIMNLDKTVQILSHFPDSHIIEIEHYKDVFNRRGQSFTVQHNSQALILASKKGKLVYEGAPVCQSFGNEYFYYTSCVMNCLYDCEYCYLKGMYPTGNMVIFVNIEDIFKEIEEILKMHSAYICVSYDTDLLAIEGITGFVKEWIDFVAKHSNLTIELRTKCGRTDIYSDKYLENLCDNYSDIKDRVVFAYTMSPQYIIDNYEHYTASLSERVKAVTEGIKNGFAVRLCFDPMIYCKDWRIHYQNMLDYIAENVEFSKIKDVSVGSFRISQDYLKNMRRQLKNSAVVWYPYELDNGYCHYPKELLKECEEFMTGKLGEYIEKDRIFRWEN